jgi:hypothetical protein
LRSLVASLGTNDWALIAEQMPGKNVRQCKERWTNYLAPDLNAAPWTHEEDIQLVQKYAEVGAKWVHIASFFPNRTDSMVKNRFNKLQRREHKRCELIMRGELVFAIPLLQSPIVTQAPASPPPPPLPKFCADGEFDLDAELTSELWMEPSFFTDEMFSF